MEGGFGSDFGGSSSGKLDPGLIMEQVKVQIAVANAQELLQVRGRPGTGAGATGPPLGADVAAKASRVSTEDDGQVFPEVYRETWGLSGQLRAGETRRGSGQGSRGSGFGGEASARAQTNEAARRSGYRTRALCSPGGLHPG